MIEIVYGDYELQENEVYIDEKPNNLLNQFLSKGKTYVVENKYINLTKKELIWIIEKTRRPVKILLKDKHIKFLTKELSALRKAQKNKFKIQVIDNTEKPNSIFDYMDRIAFDTDREQLHKDLIKFKIPLFPVLEQMLLWPDKLGNKETLLLMSDMIKVTEKTLPELVSFVFKPIPHTRISWWSRQK